MARTKRSTGTFLEADTMLLELSRSSSEISLYILSPLYTFSLRSPRRNDPEGVFFREVTLKDVLPVTVLISKDEFYSIQSERVINESFGGSLPAFVAAFTSRQNLSEGEIEEIRAIIDKMKRS